jgi:putative tricarboxylic transport membrane protein
MQARRVFGLEGAFDLLLLVAGCVIAYVSWGYGFGSIARPGPGLYPFFLGLAIALIALCVLIANWKSPPEHKPLERNAARTLLYMAATFCLWIAAMPLLGYVVVTLIAAYAFCKAMKLEGTKKPLAVSFGTALFIYLLFDVWLYIDLPRGIFGSG